MVRLQDFSDGYFGYCVTSKLDGKEFVLSQMFVEGTKGVGDAMRTMCDQMRDIPTITFRWMTLIRGMELEQKGMRLTNKAPDASAIVKREFGIRKGLSKKKTAFAFEILLELARMMMIEGEHHVR